MNDFLDKVSEFLSKYPGLLPILGLVLIVVNLVLQLFPGNWFVDRNILLHLGLIISLIGLLVIRPLT
ncbi:MAG: hypothetical protein H6652_05060 [Ardenticatenaceae bacterium]|nr:hypothetical protein [Ardenticatenaceae bacterium]MCB8946551.1 hypothetical protein [Ardenticatenaceae bacterium]